MVSNKDVNFDDERQILTINGEAHQIGGGQTSGFSLIKKVTVQAGQGDCVICPVSEIIDKDQVIFFVVFGKETTFSLFIPVKDLIEEMPGLVGFKYNIYAKQTYSGYNNNLAVIGENVTMSTYGALGKPSEVFIYAK